MSHPLLPCLCAWPKLAVHAGIDPQIPPEWLRKDGSVMRFGPAVLKHVPKDYPRVVRAHRQAARLLKSNHLNRAAPFWGFDDAHHVVMVGAVEGQRIGILARDGEHAAALCGLAGRWLNDFHTARTQSVAPFNALGPLHRVPSEAFYLPEEYANARRCLAAMAERLQGTEQKRAVLHGDLNGSNLIVRENVVTGIDFDNLRPHPALRDAGQVLAALHLWAKTPPQDVLPDTWRSAFEAHYGTCGELLDFFVLQRLLLHWSQVPATLHVLGPSRLRMAENLSAMFDAKKVPLVGPRRAALRRGLRSGRRFL